MSLMRAVQRRELQRIPDEEHRLGNHQSGGYSHRAGTRTVLLNTKSWLPSSVYNFMAQPWTSRRVSADPVSPPTVETRRRHSVFFPTLLRKLAEVMSVQSSVTSKTPNALRIVRCVLLVWSWYVPCSLCMNDTWPRDISMKSTGSNEGIVRTAPGFSRVRSGRGSLGAEYLEAEPGLRHAHCGPGR